MTALAEQLAQATQEVARLKLQNALLLEELYLARHRQFGRKTEQAVVENLPLFDESVPGIANAPTDTQPVNVGAHQRARKAGRKPLPDNLPRTEIVHDIPEADKHCACGHDLVCIGEEVSERLALIPRKLFVQRHIRPKYACHHCEGSGDEDKPAVRIAAPVPSVIPKSIVTPSLLATIFTAKYCDHLPYYRQEEQFARAGLELSRQDMSNWTIKIGHTVKPLIDRLETRLLHSEFIQMDETPVQVLGEPDRLDTTKSYMWLARGGPPGQKIILYRYQPTRSAVHPARFLANYAGYLQTDGYEAYTSAIAGLGIVHVGCWAHARRKFDEAAKVSKQGATAHAALSKIQQLYAVERTLRERLAGDLLTSESFVEQRRVRVEPILVDIHAWLITQSASVLPSSLTGKAITYSLGQWDKLVRYIDRTEITPDNNACENAIRPFVLGRKNWLFSGSPAGAEASCALYTLIETAKANGLKPWDYLHHLFTELPIISESELAPLLPLA